MRPAIWVLIAALGFATVAQAAAAMSDDERRRYQQIADELAQEGRHQEAAQLLENTLGRKSLGQWHAHQRRTATKLRWIAQARLAERRGEGKRALVFWKRASELDPGDPALEDSITALQARLNPPTPQVRRAADLNLIQYKPFVEEYVISRGDVIEVYVWQQPDLTRDVVVRPDGRISFPLVGDVEAAGMPLTRLDQVITQRLKTYVKMPDVSVAIRRFGGTKTIVLGEVGSPGIYIPAEEGRVLDVIAMAGGFQDHAVKDNVMLIRGAKGQQEVAKLDLHKALTLGVMEENVRLQPNDIVFVPKQRINSVLEFLDDFYPVIDELLVGQSIATGFGADPRIRKSDRPRN